MTNFEFKKYPSIDNFDRKKELIKHLKKFNYNSKGEKARIPGGKIISWPWDDWK